MSFGQPRGGVGVRLFVGGASEAKRDFQEFRNEGKRAFSEIAGGARGANPALLAFSRTVHEGRTQVADLAQGTGAAGRILGAFGVAGIGAAAALGGLAIAVNQARAAMKFADEISDSAAKVGIGTDALQEYRFAIHAAGGEASDADAAIAGFTKALGAAESGLSPRVMKAFAALGFTRDQLRSFDSADDALQEVTRRIAGLSKESERAAVADKLGLTPMLPLLRKGADGMEELREKARSLGIVMDDELVAKAGDANDKLEVMSQIIDVQLKSAFVELAPYIVAAAEALANLVKGLADFLNDPRTHEALDAIGRIAGAGARGGVGGAGIQAGREIAGAGRGPGRLSSDFGMDADDPDAIIAAARARAAGGGARLVPQGGGGKKTKKKGPTWFDNQVRGGGQVLGDDDLLTSYGADGKASKSRSKADQAYNDAFGFYPGEAPEKVEIAFDADLTTLDGKVRPWLDRTHDAVKDTFAGGIEAAFSGDLLSFIKARLVSGLADGLAESLTNIWSQATGGGMSSGGGVGSFLLNAGASLFKRNAVGGQARPGEVSSVAEFGDELALFGRNGRVFSHDETVRMLQQAAGGNQGGAPAVHVTYAPSYQVTGSGPEVDRLRGEIQRDRETFHGRVVGAVNDAIGRRQIKAA